MARNDIPNFETPDVAPEVNSVDYNLFYQPQQKPRNQAVESLVNSLSEIIPTLGKYQVSKDIKKKQKDEARAVQDFETNKVEFASLVKSGQISAGANPHYFNKMMELELGNKAREFQSKFDSYYAESGLSKKLSPEAFTLAYEQQLKDYYKENNLDRFDPLALEKAFFQNTSSFRNQREQQHNAKRIAEIEKFTEDQAVKNYTGMFIDAQFNELNQEELHQKIKDETQSFISLGVEKSRANELFLAGVKSYLENINDELGFEYARSLIDGMSTLKLGTGYFAGEKGSFRNRAIQEELKGILNTKELAFLDQKKSLEDKRNDAQNVLLTNQYYDVKGTDGFNILSYVDQKEERNGIIVPKFTTKEKDFLITFHNATEANKQNRINQPDALKELNELVETNPFAVRDKAFELVKNSQITNETYEKYYSVVGRETIITTNPYFRNSQLFQNYRQLFQDKLVTQAPELSSISGVAKADFEENMVAWHLENKDNPEFKNKPLAYKKAFNDQVKVEVADVFSNSPVIQENFEEYKQLFLSFGIVLKQQ